MDFPELENNLSEVRERISAAQSESGASDPVAIVAVTKGHPVSAIHASARAGLTEIGENRIQEALQKNETAGHLPLKWHLIGHLQTNKSRYVPGVFGMIHSVDSLRLARALDKEFGKRECPSGVSGNGGKAPRLEVLLQVSLAGEEQKSGCSAEEADELAHAISELQFLNLRGLMTMAPLTKDEGVVRGVFAKARDLKQQLSRDLKLPVLSMGMSGDFELAVKEGATMVRLGTRLFGGRQQ
jgi:pyridoxal phosphate enzyme (YggS family)